MERRYIDKLMGKTCKIVTMEPGSKRASIITGIIEKLIKNVPALVKINRLSTTHRV